MLATVLALLFATALAPDVKTQIDAIRIELRADRHDKAIELGEALVKSQPSCSACFGWLGKAYGAKAIEASVFSQLSLAKKCRTAFEKAAALDPTSVEALFDLLSYYRNAPGIVGGGMDKARDVAARIEKLDPARGHLARASIFEKEKDLAKAEAEYRKAVEIGPDDASLLGNLTGFLNRQKKPADAMAVCMKAAAAHPGDPAFKYQVGRAAAITGLEAETGLKALEEYIAAPATGDEVPSAADARWRRGQIFEKQGKRAEARAEYAAALTLQPKHQAAEDLKRLEKS